MKPPKCKGCGKEEWGHVCSGSDAEHSVSNAPESGSITNKPELSLESITNMKAHNRTMRWRKENPERYRAYMRDYMKGRRAQQALDG